MTKLLNVGLALHRKLAFVNIWSPKKIKETNTIQLTASDHLNKWSQSFYRCTASKEFYDKQHTETTLKHCKNTF